MREEVTLHVDKAEYHAQARLLKQHNYGAMILLRGAPKWPAAAMQTLPLAPSVELLWGHDPRDGCAEMARGRHANLATGAF
eukprot:470729-Pyramimonas_sp.AAC.1